MIDRRNFLRVAGMATFSAAMMNRGLADELRDLGKGKRVGLIGCGWYGKVDLLRLLQIAPVEVAGLCDVDSLALKGAGEIVAARQVSKKTPALFADYREMLAKEKFDLVLIDTPDHWHALPALAALEAGAHLYLQKPTAVDVVESRAILDTARRLDRVVQVGTQRRSTAHLIEAKNKVIDEELLGRVGHVEICCYYGMGRDRREENAPPPGTLDWEMWTGPAPMREFNPAIHPRGWRMFSEYGNGIVGDMAVHMLDTVRWMLDLGAPETVKSSGGTHVHRNGTGNVPDTQTAIFGFPDFDIVWNHRTYGPAPDRDYPWAFFIYGEKGTLKGSVHRWEFVPNGGGKAMSGEVVYELEEFPEDKTEKDLEQHVAPAVRAHLADFLQCVESGENPVADIEQGHLSSSACILANVALELGRPLAWDAEKNILKGDEEGTARLARKYRGDWIHP